MRAKIRTHQGLASGPGPKPRPLGFIECGGSIILSVFKWSA